MSTDLTDSHQATSTTCKCNRANVADCDLTNAIADGAAGEKKPIGSPKGKRAKATTSGSLALSGPEAHRRATEICYRLTAQGFSCKLKTRTPIGAWIIGEHATLEFRKDS